MPARARSVTTRFAPCFVRVNTSALSTRPSRSSCGSRRFFSAFSAKNTPWRMASTVVAGGVTITLAGRCRSESASCSISAGMVALNKRFCRFAGSCAITRRTSCTKPMSSMRSASSSTNTSSCASFTYPCPIRSFRRPGVAVSTSTPRCSAATCGACPTPPKITVCARGRYLPYRAKLSSICSASSRVGVRMSARMGRPGARDAASRCKMGSANAAVLPVPVCAQPSRSRPASTGPMACC